MTTDTATSYEAEQLHWRQERNTDLTSEDGWLTVVGLDWLRDGVNTIGSAPGTDVTLPDSTPAQLGTLTLADGVVTLDVTADVEATIDGVPVRSATLKHDTDEGGPSRVVVGTVNFFIILRSGQYGVRIRDRASAARQSFEGRHWFPVDESYRVTGQFTPHQPPRTVEVPTVTGQVSTMKNVGRIDFTLHGEALSLEAFAARDNQVWIILRDGTSGKQSYGAGRFLYAPLAEDGTVTLDFNRAYHPPCAFTHYATCPMPPRENILTLPIEAGERN
jgi:uncharacterized protein (DUF1684 family)